LASRPSVRWLALLGAAGVAIGLSACGSAASKEPTEANIASGKQKFAVCGSCHALADSGLKGQAEIENVPVPDFDDSFRALREQGFQESSIRGLVMGWIELAQPPMPRNMLKGQDAYDVAAYIASVAGTSPESTPRKALSPGTLQPVGQSPQTPGAEPPHQTSTEAVQTGATPEPVQTGAGGGGETGGGGGTGATGGGGAAVPVETDPGGDLAFTQKTLTAGAGKVTLKLRNDSPVPHNIAIRGNGVNAGPSETIQGGATADLTATLKPGTYEYYCAVPGHEQGGMKGKLTVR
jgi:plastocyanin/cytochrome c553